MLRKIERLRRAMHRLAERHGIQDPLVIRVSQRLDNLIVEYMNGSPHRRPISPEEASQEEARRLLDSIVRLHEEVEGQPERLFAETDPATSNKFRELDKLIVAFLRQ
ncbi:Spo0E family sporulation regulatory protein-aspartic acid phosphatase [Cohnella sp. GCM10027633]|uniref:Spo0E family sporulation regulatory protein-aspartic acid phosphatase n=1 Tax=unclassified Cohnella TaxID=2636738 RepID=UPI0036369839